MKTTILVALFFLAGCGSNAPYDHGEKIDEFIVKEAGCAKAGGVMVVKRTGTRIRRPIARDRLATAKCEEKP